MAKGISLSHEDIERLNLNEIEVALSEQQKTFAIEYIKCQNGTEAALKAGYAKKSAYNSAYQLKQNPLIQRFIELNNQKRMERLNISADRVLNEFAKIGFFNIEEIYDEDGNILPIHEMPIHASAGISKIRERLIVLNDDDTKVIEREYHFHNKLSALENLGKHLGIYEKDNEQNRANVNLYLPDNNREKKDEK